MEDVRGLTNGKLGQFDYVIAHGVYGWIPEEADDALLQTIKASLAPGGIAYVSFNAQPGGYFRRLLRDAGLWHARDEVGAEAKATKAQELYRFLNEQRVSDSDTYGMLLGREVPALADAQSYRLVHDDLSENWKPRWFAEFAGHAAGHGLAYVGEADLYSLRSEMLPAGVEPHVWNLADGDRIAFENLSDLLIGRHFRQSIVCHAGGPRRRSSALPERTHGAALGRPAERRAAGGGADRGRVPRARSAAPARGLLRDAAGAARGRARRAGGGAARRLPARAADAARRAAARGDGAGRAADARRGWRAGRRRAAPTWSRSPTCGCGWRSRRRAC